jgi:hypothetical protein
MLMASVPLPAAPAPQPVVERRGQSGPREVALRAQGVPADPARAAFKGLELIYYRKVADENLVTSALNRSGIPYSVTGADDAGGPGVNTIACSPDVSVDALKQVASALLSGGVPIGSVRQFVKPSEKPGRIEVVATALTTPGAVIAPAQIQGLTGCPQDLEPLQATPQ